MDEDAGNGAAALAHGLVDEVHEAAIERFVAGPAQQRRHFATVERLAGAVDVVEDFEKALAFDLGDRLAHGFSDDVALADDLVIQLVGQLEDMIRAAQRTDERGRLFDDGRQLQAFRLDGAGERFAFGFVPLLIGDVAG